MYIQFLLSLWEGEVSCTKNYFFPLLKAKFRVLKIASRPLWGGLVSCTKNYFPGKARFHVPKIASFSPGKVKFHVLKITSSPREGYVSCAKKV